jgi:formylglycine-generating enzyme required for sulfatase activity
VVTRDTKQARYYVEDLGNGVTLEMVEVPGGTFMMGSTESEVQTAFAEAKRYSGSAKLEWFTAETPRHRVTLPTFFMGRFEVTQAQWRAVMGGDPSAFKGDNLPVESVSWNDAKDFCARLKQRTGKAYRLPSEAEWEYACRAGTTTPFAFGETITPQVVNYDGNYPYASAPKGEYREKTVPVGSLGVANAFGLSDLHGNVWEWCEDVWHPNYNGAPDDGRAWTTGGDQNYRVLRGGSWDSTLGGAVAPPSVTLMGLVPAATLSVFGSWLRRGLRSPLRSCPLCPLPCKLCPLRAKRERSAHEIFFEISPFSFCRDDESGVRHLSCAAVRGTTMEGTVAPPTVTIMGLVTATAVLGFRVVVSARTQK